MRRTDEHPLQEYSITEICTKNATCSVKITAARAATRSPFPQEPTDKMRSRDVFEGGEERSVWAAGQQIRKAVHNVLIIFTPHV